MLYVYNLLADNVFCLGWTRSEVETEMGRKRRLQNQQSPWETGAAPYLASAKEIVALFPTNTTFKKH
jgi:hypothetical protein